MDSGTGKKIIEEQNRIENIRCLAAQRELYSRAKKILALQVFLTVALVVCFSFLSLKYDIQVFFSIYCVLVTIFDILFLNQIMDGYKEKAAQIQETFDTKVFGIEWNSLIDRVDTETIFRFSEKFKKKESGFSSLENWYSEKISEVNSEEAILICQRSNCAYDASLRNSFRILISSVSAISCILIIVFSSINGIMVSNLFSTVLLPLLPVISFFILRNRENRGALVTLSKMYQFVCEVWSRSILNKPACVKKLARQIQDRIYHNRKDSPLIFDWYYSLFRRRLESEMEYSVEQLVNEFMNNKIK